MKLKDQVAIVTGAGRGIGRVIALGLAHEGADVLVAAQTEDQINAVAEEIRGIGRHSLAVKTDVANEVSVSSMVQRCIDELGTVDILINNAGIHGFIGPVLETTIQSWDRTIAVNLRGPFLCCQAVLSEMISKKQGKIINIAAGGSLIGVANFAAYCASKAGLVRFTESLAEEVRQFNVSVYAVEPRRLETKMRGESRAAGLQLDPGRPPEAILPVILFLLSNKSDHLTGRFIHMDEIWHWSKPC